LDVGGAVGNQGEQGVLDVEAEVLAGLGARDVADAQTLSARHCSLSRRYMCPIVSVKNAMRQDIRLDAGQRGD
jgi:hypothetical protein